MRPRLAVHGTRRNFGPRHSALLLGSRACTPMCFWFNRFLPLLFCRTCTEPAGMTSGTVSLIWALCADLWDPCWSSLAAIVVAACDAARLRFTHFVQGLLSPRCFDKVICLYIVYGTHGCDLPTTSSEALFPIQPRGFHLRHNSRRTCIQMRSACEDHQRALDAAIPLSSLSRYSQF